MVEKIHKTKQPKRPHFIREWAEKFGYMTQAELVRASGIDKSVVNRWYSSGGSPGEDHQMKLAGLFSCDPEALFRHPDDDWLSRFFKNKSDDERARAVEILKNAFPQKNGTNG